MATFTRISRLSEKGWYPSDPTALRTLLSTCMPLQRVSHTYSPQAVICPHAGIAYSGSVTASVLSQCSPTDYDRVVIIGPSHFVPFSNVIHTSNAAAIETPLGRVSVDVELVSSLRKASLVTYIEGVDDQEHASDIMLPFLQFFGFDVPVVPLIMGHFSTTHLDVLSESLRSFLPPKTLVLVSSDFTHYGEAFHYLPFADNIQENLRRLDVGAAELIIRGDLKGFERYLQETGVTICGHIPIQLMMRLLGESFTGSISAYKTSSEITGNWHHAVSYIGALLGRMYTE